MMVKFIMTDQDTGRRTLGMGITRENLIRLLQENPIHIMAEDLNLKDLTNVHEISIAYFDKEGDLMNFLKHHGLITDETKIHSEDKKLVN